VRPWTTVSGSKSGNRKWPRRPALVDPELPWQWGNPKRHGPVRKVRAANGLMFSDPHSGSCPTRFHREGRRRHRRVAAGFGGRPLPHLAVSSVPRRRTRPPIPVGRISRTGRTHREGPRCVRNKYRSTSQRAYDAPTGHGRALPLVRGLPTTCTRTASSGCAPPSPVPQGAPARYPV
jgi:hypothetical protein